MKFEPPKGGQAEQYCAVVIDVDMGSAETQEHKTLKRLALIWAQQQGFTICGLEIRLPKSGYRADVVGYKPAKRGGSATTAVFECKQSRADFLKDSHRSEPTRSRLQKLQSQRETLERLLGIHHPSLRKGETLFTEYDTIDLSGLEHKRYRSVLREIGVLQNRLHGKTKFDRVTRYGCANLCYLVVEAEIVEEQELPLGWGLLVHCGSILELRYKPHWQDAAEQDRLTLLERIATTSTRQLNHEQGIKFEEIAGWRVSESVVPVANRGLEDGADERT
ncbi:MAG: hypothetical protein WCS70_02840 [Verrucomicrobiota bacterium]